VCPICNIPIVPKPNEDPNIVLDDHINQGCAVKASTGYKCNSKGCKKVDVVPIVCKLCRRHHCVRHRFEADHNCPRKPQKAAPKPKITSTTNHAISNSNASTNKTPTQNNNNTANSYPGSVSNSQLQRNIHNSNNNNIQPQRSSIHANNRATPAAPSRPQVSQNHTPSETTVGVRLTNGELIRQVCNSNTTLREVQLFIDQNRTDGSGPYVMRTTYPPRELAFSDLDRTLQQLGLVPSGMIILQSYQIEGHTEQVHPPPPSPSPQTNQQQPAEGGSWWGTISSFFSSIVPQ